jgi:hypothetical protein
MNKQKLNINENKLYNKLNKNYWIIQSNAIKKYKNIIKSQFYTTIAQDYKYIEDLNNIMNEYKLHIDYFPRIKDTNNDWIIDTIYLPIYITELT